MFCPECGRQVPEGAAFCPGCGRYVSSGYTFVQAPDQPSTTTTCYDYAEPVSRPRRLDSSKLTTVLIVVMAVAAIILVPILYAEERGSLYGKSFTESYSGETSGYTVRSCEWEYLDGQFSCSYGIKNTDYSAHQYESPSLRNVTYWADSVDFVEINSTVIGLEATLAKLYKQAFGTDPQADQAYADFILAFVQGAITYMTDQNQYGYAEFYTYPTETLYSKKGDCEDTAILCAALYKQAGFTAALLTLPGHMMVGVALSAFTTPSYADSGEILKQTIGTRTFYAGETTVDSFQPVGVSYGSHKGYMYSYYLNAGIVGQGAYTFYEVGA